MRQVTDWGVISASVLLCLFLLPHRFPGMELLGIGANWLLIWVVAWSVKRSAFQGAFAGIILGLLQDAMTAPHPTHAISLGIVGFLVGLFQKERFIQEDFISIALIVFLMAMLSDTIFALQLQIGDSSFRYSQQSLGTRSLLSFKSLVAAVEIGRTIILGVRS